MGCHPGTLKLCEAYNRDPTCKTPLHVTVTWKSEWASCLVYHSVFISWRGKYLTLFPLFLISMTGSELQVHEDPSGMAAHHGKEIPVLEMHSKNKIKNKR